MSDASSETQVDGEGSGKDIDLNFLQPAARPESLGRLGHYEVLQVLGKGGFGIVFRAFDEVLQRVVAVKVLAPQMAATSPARKRFLREARSAAKIRHENVVQVYAVEEQPLPYLVMEFIPGESLQDRLDRTGPLEAMEVVQIGRQIAEGLAAAHATGLIHRDIKPANILVEAGAQARVKITDFGLARAADDASLTQSGLVAGTPLYMAPEQAQGDALDHRADLFSLGSVLYTICSGRPPFRANTTLAILRRVAEDTPRPIPEIIPEVPPWLCDIITRLHAKKPEDRVATAREVADLLAHGEPVVQRPVNVPNTPHVVRAQSPSPAPSGRGEREGVTEKMPPSVRLSDFVPVRRHGGRMAGRWDYAAVLLLILAAGFGLAEVTGTTDFHGQVMQWLSPEGTLVVYVDAPDLTVKVNGSDIGVTKPGPNEIRLKPGRYTVEAGHNGMLVQDDDTLLRQQSVTITAKKKSFVRVTRDPRPLHP